MNKALKRNKNRWIDNRLSGWWRKRNAVRKTLNATQALIAAYAGHSQMQAIRSTPARSGKEKILKAIAMAECFGSCIDAMRKAASQHKEPKGRVGSD